VHGYCAGQNEFPKDEFTNAIQFQDYSQARSNDAFALKIREFGNQFPAFSIVRASPRESALHRDEEPFRSRETSPFLSRFIRSRTRRVVSLPLTCTATTGRTLRTLRAVA
jgi:hypothetical protein